jgi:7-cyano-7-deazaguanine synthase in queuosine biosynthesis
MSEARVVVGGEQHPMSIRINGADPNFHLRTDTIRAMARSELEPRHLDLLEIAATVFAADGARRRGGPTRPGMGRQWRRSLDFKIPARDPAFWAQPHVTEALVDTVGFLTEDNVSFEFTGKPVETDPQPFLDLDPQGAAFEASEVILFSGGLDSFCGALEVLDTTSSKVILLTHRSAQKAIPRQVELGEHLAKKFRNRVLHINVLARRKGQEASDSSQRSRSLLFAALGQLVAGAFGAQRISFYENGIISQNLPISPQVVGTMATRTTHPLALRKLATLIQTLGSDQAPIENRYSWLTKRDVVERIAHHGGAKQIARTVSCTSIREQTTRHTHCGTCSQCLDRRFAILAAGLDEFDFAEDYGTDVLFGVREKTASTTMAVEWTRHALKMARIEPRGFLKDFGLEFGRIAEGHPDQRKQDVLDKCLYMHLRHGQNVQAVLRKVLSERSDDILLGELASTSLVSLFLAAGTRGELELPADPRIGAAPPPPIPVVEEMDIVPDPEDPLQVLFQEDGGRPVVSVIGLCRLTGATAEVPDTLKEDYFSDKAAKAASADHRYVQTGYLASRLSVSKEVLRQRVKRCREILRDSFCELHGLPPEEDLLLQRKAAKGYRLDPDIIVVDGLDSPLGVDVT